MALFSPTVHVSHKLEVMLINSVPAVNRHLVRPALPISSPNQCVHSVLTPLEGKTLTIYRHGRGGSERVSVRPHHTARASSSTKVSPPVYKVTAVVITVPTRSAVMHLLAAPATLAHPLLGHGHPPSQTSFCPFDHHNASGMVWKYSEKAETLGKSRAI